MAKPGQPAKTAKGPVPKRKADSSLSPDEDRYKYIYKYADDHSKGYDWARRQISQIAKSKGDKYLASDGKLVSRKEEKEKAAKARRQNNTKIEKERILKKISDITGGVHIDKYEKLNLDKLRDKLVEWEKKAKILDSVRSVQGDEAAENLINSNPVEGKWDIAGKSALGEALTDDERKVADNLYSKGRDELEARKAAGVVNEGTDFTEAESIHYTESDYTRKQFRDRFVIPGPNVPELYGWQQTLNAEIDNLVKQGLLTEAEANKFVQEWGHRGSVAIPGFASRANYESNVNSESRLYNSSTGHGMTVPETHNANIHMSSGEGYTLSDKSKQHLDELIERFPNSAIAKKAQAVLDNVPMSDIIDIGDPNRDAKFGGDPRDELLLFSNSKVRPAGSLSRELTHDQGRSAIHYLNTLEHFDFNTHFGSIALPQGVTQADVDRIKNAPDFINASITLLFILFVPHLLSISSKLVKFPFESRSSKIISIIELPTPLIAPRP